MPDSRGADVQAAVPPSRIRQGVRIFEAALARRGGRQIENLRYSRQEYLRYVWRAVAV